MSNSGNEYTAFCNTCERHFGYTEPEGYDPATDKWDVVCPFCGSTDVCA